MRRLAFGGLLLVACGGSGSAGEVTIPAQGVPPPVAPMPSAPGALDTSLPKDAAALVVFDLALVRRAAAAAFEPPTNRAEAVQIEHRIEETLALTKGSLAPDRVFDTLGLDPSRPGAIALAPLDASARPALARLEAVAASAGAKSNNAPPASGTFGAIKAALGDQTPLVHARVRLPIHDAAAATRALRHALSELRLREVATLPGIDLVMAKSGQTIAVSSDASWLVLDFLWRLAPGERPEATALRAVGELRANASPAAPEQPLDLGGALALVHLVPRSIAELGFVTGVEETEVALTSADPAQQDRIAAQGLFEAHACLDLAGDARGPFFRTVDARLDASQGMPLVTATAWFGPAYEASGRAGASAARGTPFETSGATGLIEASIPVGLGFALPGDTKAKLTKDSEMEHLIRNAGWSAWLIAAPLAPVTLMTLALRPPFEPFNPPAAALKLERLGLVQEHGEAETFVGLVRAGASEAEASCVLSGATPCAHPLRPGAVAVKIDQRWVRLLRLDNRFVVIIGEAGAVERLRPTLGSPSMAVGHARIPGTLFRDSVAFSVLDPQLADTYEATLDLDESSFKMRVERR